MIILIIKNKQYNTPVDFHVFALFEQSFQSFLQLTNLSKDGSRDTVVDMVFKGALRHFRNDLFTQLGIALQVGPS